MPMDVCIALHCAQIFMIICACGGKPDLVPRGGGLIMRSECRLVCCLRELVRLNYLLLPSITNAILGLCTIQFLCERTSSPIQCVILWKGLDTNQILPNAQDDLSWFCQSLLLLPVPNSSPQLSSAQLGHIPNLQYASC